MSTVIERLKASKEKHMQESASLGRAAGRAWASNNAEYGDLVRVSKIKALEWPPDDWAYFELQAAVDPEKGMNNKDLCYCFGIDEADLSNEDFLDGFIEGAKEVYEEIEDQL